MELLAEPLVHLKCFFFFFFFCFVFFSFSTDVLMDETKSVVHRLKSFAQDAQLKHVKDLRKVSLGGPEGCPGRAGLWLQGLQGGSTTLP